MVSGGASRRGDAVSCAVLSGQAVMNGDLSGGAIMGCAILCNAVATQW